jgi:uncharacterized cupin superfamily protein
MASKIDIPAAPYRKGSAYPMPYDQPCLARERWRLGDGAGLGQFGVNLMRLPPGAWSSQRHWHTAEDEFVWVLEGEVVLVTDAGEELLRAGDCAGFKAGVADGHHLQNRSDRPALVLEVGARRPAEDATHYSEADMQFARGSVTPTRRDGSPFGPQDFR